MWGHFCFSHFQYFNPFYVVFRVCLHVPRVFQTRVYFLHACGFVYFSHVCVFTLNTRRTIAFCFVFRCVAESILFPSNTLMTGSSPLCIIFLTLLRKYELFGFYGFGHSWHCPWNNRLRAALYPFWICLPLSVCPVIRFIVLPICFIPLFVSWLCGLKGFINSLDPRLGYMSRLFALLRCSIVILFSWF